MIFDLRAAAAALALLAFSAPGLADPVYPAAAEKVSYAALDSLPDWRGIWLPKGTPFLSGGEKPRLKGKYLDIYNKTVAGIKIGKAPEARSSNCLPPGMPLVMMQPYDIEFLFTPGRVTIIQEAYMQVRRVFTDGRPLPDDPDPTFNGTSIGHWEGDTLVIKTVGINEETLMGRFGVTHGPKLTITERIHLKQGDKDTLVDELTFDDPDALEAPWTQSYEYTRNREFNQLEFICAENDRNPISTSGHTEFEDVESK